MSPITPPITSPDNAPGRRRSRRRRRKRRRRRRLQGLAAACLVVAVSAFSMRAAAPSYSLGAGGGDRMARFTISRPALFCARGTTKA